MTAVWRWLRRVWQAGRADHQARWSATDDTVGFQ